MEPLFHALIPALAAMAAGEEPRRVVPLCIVGALPDLDSLLATHRTILHSYLVLSAISLILIGLAKLLRPEHVREAVLASLFLLSHPALDVFGWYIEPAWPISVIAVTVDFEVLVNVLKPLETMTFIMGIKTAFGPSLVPPPSSVMLSGNGLILLGIFVAVVIVRLRRGHEPPMKSQ